MEMPDQAIPVSGHALGKTGDQKVRRLNRHQFGDILGLLRDKAHGRADAGNLGKAEQRLDRGRPRNADADRQGVAGSANAALPVENGVSLEAELGLDIVQQN